MRTEIVELNNDALSVRWLHILRAGIWMLALWLVAAPARAIELAPAPSEPPPPRMVWMISDLHFGVGRVKQDPGTGTWTVGNWHPMEDFRWAPEFAKFLQAIDAKARASNMASDLVILGDFLELWQSTTDDCRHWTAGDPSHWKKDLGCTSAEALARARRVLGAHADALRHLRDFANSGANRLILVPGNHDAALVFEAVAQATVDAVGAKPGRVRVAVEGYWRSADGTLIAEHGHQMEGDVNKFDVLPASCLDDSGKSIPCNATGKVVHLRRSWGEQFVQSYYNQFEERFPIIDNISEEGRGVRLGLAAASIGEIKDATADALKFLATQMSWDQVKQGLGSENQLPIWDLTKIKEMKGAFIIESLPTSDPLRALLATKVDAATRDKIVASMSDDEIRMLCDYRYGLANSNPNEEEAKKKIAGVHPCPAKTESLGGVAASLFSSEYGRHRARLKELREALARLDADKGDFRFYVYGHTHGAHEKILPFEEGDDWRPAMWNTGAWQRVVTPDQLDDIMGQCKIDSKKALRVLRPEHLPPCYSTVEYVMDGSKAQEPALRWWRKSKTGVWSFDAACNDWKPECPNLQ